MKTTPQVVRSLKSDGPLKVLLWSINYAPEETGIAPCNVALCEFLREQGHEIEVVTSFAYYPLWKKRPEDCGRLFRTDLVNDVPVHRCWHYVPDKVVAWKRIFHELTFVVVSAVRVFALRRSDVMVVVSPPLLIGAAAWVVSRLRRTPFLFHVQDLQPDAAIGLGMLKTGGVSRALYALESFAYRTAARVSGITRGMLAAFARKGIAQAKQCYLPNGIELPDSFALPPKNRFRARLGISEDALLSVYSGNLGVKQGLSILIEAASLCKDPRVQVVICGDGAEKAALAALIEERKLDNVHLLPLQERSQYEEMLVDADLCLITQRAGTGQFFFPSKLLTTLAYGKPVLAVADCDSELAVSIQEGEFGFCVPTGEPEAIVNVWERVVASRGVLEGMGRRGRAYVEQFEIEKVMAHFEAVLRSISSVHHGAIVPTEYERAGEVAPTSKQAA